MTLSSYVLGGWKPTVESSAFSYTEPQRGRDLYSSPKFSTAASNSLGFNGNNSLGAVSSNAYWSNTSMVENVMDTSSHGAKREPVEKKQNTRNGCRLFGFQLLGNSNVEEASPVSTPKMVGEDRPVPPIDTAFDQHFDPSNIHRSDMPSVSCDADKSCLISPLESQSRQIRSCTKVFQSISFSSLRPISSNCSEAVLVEGVLTVWNIFFYKQYFIMYEINKGRLLIYFLRFKCKELLLGGP